MYWNVNNKNLFFYSGFNFETLLDFSNLNHSKNSELSAYFSLMANALNIHDISAKSANIYEKYDVRIFKNDNYINYTSFYVRRLLVEYIYAYLTCVYFINCNIIKYRISFLGF